MSLRLQELEIVTVEPNKIDLQLSHGLVQIGYDAARGIKEETGISADILDIFNPDNTVQIDAAHERFMRLAKNGALAVAYARGVPVGYALAHRTMPGNVVKRARGHTVNSVTTAARRLLPSDVGQRLTRFDHPVNAKFEAIVDQDYRGGGVGKALINEALSPFEDSLVPTTEVYEKNIAMASFMNHLGLKPTRNERFPTGKTIQLGSQEAPIRFFEFSGQSVGSLRRATAVNPRVPQNSLAYSGRAYITSPPIGDHNLGNTKADLERIGRYLEWAHEAPINP